MKKPPDGQLGGHSCTVWMVPRAGQGTEGRHGRRPLLTHREEKEGGIIDYARPGINSMVF